MNPAFFSLVLSLLGAGDVRPFVIEVVDDRTGRGVPLIELSTVNHIRLVTDSNGLAAFDEPGLMDQSVFFHVKGHGYEYPKDGFGYRGKALDVRPGGSARLKVKRINVAERLYRVTGEGIYRDTVLAGRPAPIARPLLNARVFGSDSVVNAVYKGKIHWFWGDTNRPGYPLGLFHVPGATSRLPADGGLDPEVGVDLDYEIGPDGFARATAQLPGEGPTWIFGLVVVRDGAGRERMFASYSKIRPPLETYERGLVEYDDETRQFRKVATFPLNAPVLPGGQTFLKTEDSGETYVYFATPYPLTRVKADAESLARIDRYESFTCLVAGTRVGDRKVDRDRQGRPDYRWTVNTPTVGPAEQARLIRAGALKPEEALLHLLDVETGKAVQAHSGSVSWNEHRGRWVLIAVQIGGSSFLGEVWYAEADTPVGPWVYARKVVTHEKYDFYNPKEHPFFAKEKGRILYFEGTYTNTFSGNPVATPRYDYNQVMYKLDLADTRLNLPVAVYRGKELPTRRAGFVTAVQSSSSKRGGRPAFFALDRPGEGTVPVYQSPGRRLRVGVPPGDSEAIVLFHAILADMKDPPAATVLLWEFRREPIDDLDLPAASVYSTDETMAEFERMERPVCRVWRNPMRLDIPADWSPKGFPDGRGLE